MAESSRPRIPFLQALKQGPLAADGAMGTQLYERGVLFSVNYEELNLARPELVSRVHEDYVRAGAQLIETNTFGANAIRLARHGLSDKVRAINTAAVTLARNAGAPYVLGAVGPTGLSVVGLTEDERQRVSAAFSEQIAALAEASADAILLETMGQPDELLLAIAAAKREAPGIPIIAQATLNERLELSDGSDIAAVAQLMKDAGADIIGVNCSEGPQQLLAAAERLLPIGLPVSAMPNAGLPRKVDDRLIYVSTPEYFGVFARRLFKLGVAIVGGCCGTTPEHVRRIAAAARMAGSTDGSAEPDSSSDAGLALTMEPVLPAPPSGVVCVPQHEKSLLASALGKRFVVSVEVNPPIGLDTSRALAAAKMLRDGGVDVINIADGARAQARMSNVALALKIQAELGMETILHVCGRDRNLLGQLAHLLGCSALGLSNLVIITGDPPKMGDFPDATAVYDLDSVGLLRMASRLNRGLDPGGKAIGLPTSFLLATGAEPGALNYPRELARLRAKKAAGAELVMTQPVYDPRVLEKFLDDTKDLGLPTLVGILPLASYRNAEFLHNEVPGMQIPDSIRERMRKVGSGAPARKEGVAIAREMLHAVRGKVAGAYVMPPLEKYELALEVIDGFVESKPRIEALVAMTIGAAVTPRERLLHALFVTAPHLKDAALRRAFVAATLHGASYPVAARALEIVAERVFTADPRAREVLVAVAQALAEDDDLAARLREEAVGQELPRLIELLCAPPGELVIMPKPRTPPGARTLTLGEKKAFARRPDRAAIEALLVDPHPLVIRILLGNPRLTEDAVVELSARRPTPPPVLHEVARAVSWSSRQRVRMALVLNPCTPPVDVMPLLPLCTAQDLRFVSEISYLPALLRASARAIAKTRRA